MNGRKENTLILIENGQIRSVSLDDKNAWEIGRPSRENNPDIKLHSTTVSRKHGRFQNQNGIWFYFDHNSKNGTVYNHKRLSGGLNGRVRPVVLKNGDTFVFGGGQEEVINCKTIWGMFMTKSYEADWRVVDSRGYQQVLFRSADKSVVLEHPQTGSVVEREKGLAIYMGDLTYVIGEMEVTGY